MLAQHLVNSLVYGGIYAMIVIGYSLVFSLLGLINLAHGAVMSAGAVMAYIIMVDYGQNFLVTFLVVAVFSGLLGYLVEQLAVKPVLKQGLPKFYVLVTTFGLGMAITELLSNFTIAQWGQELKAFPSPFMVQTYSVRGIYFNNVQVGILVAVLVLMIALNFFVTRTWAGYALRATSQNQKVAEMMGINTSKVISVTFIMAGVSGAFAGSMLAIYYSYISADIGMVAGLKGFIAALLGGRGMITGAILGGYVLGGLENIVSGLIGTGYRDMVAFGLLILILLVRPSGLLGIKEEDRT